MYEISVSSKARKQLAKLDNLKRDRIGAVIERLRIRPHSFVKRIVGSPYFRARVGDYRIILEIQNKKLVMVVVESGSRKKIYKK